MLRILDMYQVYSYIPSENAFSGLGSLLASWTLLTTNGRTQDFDHLSVNIEMSISVVIVRSYVQWYTFMLYTHCATLTKTK